MPYFNPHNFSIREIYFPSDFSQGPYGLLGQTTPSDFPSDFSQGPYGLLGQTTPSDFPSDFSHG